MPIPPRAITKVLNPEIERILFQIKVIEEEAAGLLQGLTPAQFIWRPNPNSWSMGECADHLNATAKPYLDSMEATIANARAEKMLAEGPYVYGFVGRTFLRMLAPPVKMRTSAPAKFRPVSTKKPETVMQEWAQSHERMAKVVESASGVDLQRAKVASPASNLLKLNLGVSFWIMTTHEKRHLWQMRNVRNAPGFPTV